MIQPFDIELHPARSEANQHKRVARCAEMIHKIGGTVTDTYVHGSYMALLRAHLNGAQLDTVRGWRMVRAVEPMPRSDIEVLHVPYLSEDHQA